jgi:ferredoxin
MRIVIDRDLCDSHGLCTGEAPTVFELGDDDVLRVLVERPPEQLRSRVQSAVDRCPKRAISIEE